MSTTSKAEVGGCVIVLLAPTRPGTDVSLHDRCARRAASIVAVNIVPTIGCSRTVFVEQAACWQSGEVRIPCASNLTRFADAGGFVRFRQASLRAVPSQRCHAEG